MVKNKSTRPHILVIRLSAMGDVAMTVPVLKAMEQAYPDVNITLLTRAFFAPMFAQLANTTVYVADVKGKHKGVVGLWRLYKELKEIQIDAVADLHNVLRSKILKTFFSLDGVPVVQLDKGRAEKKALTRPDKKLFKPLITTHERYAQVFSTMGYPIKLDNSHVLHKELLPENTEVLWDTVKKVVGIAPFAAFPGKQYPKEAMEEVLNLLDTKGDYTLLLFGGGQEEKKQLQQWADQFPSCINMAGRVGFAEELAVISNLDGMLAMDSGNAHLAAMYGVPTITLWGVTHPYAGFAPFGQPEEYALLSDRDAYPLIPTSVYGNKQPQGYENCMGSIAPQTVVDKIGLLGF